MKHLKATVVASLMAGFASLAGAQSLDVMGIKLGMTRAEVVEVAKANLTNYRDGGYSHPEMRICHGETIKRSMPPSCTNANILRLRFTNEGKLFFIHRSDKLNTAANNVPYGPYMQQGLDKYAPGKKFRPSDPKASNPMFGPGLQQGFFFADYKNGKMVGYSDALDSTNKCRFMDGDSALKMAQSPSSEGCGMVAYFRVASADVNEIFNPTIAGNTEIVLVDFDAQHNSIKNAEATKEAARLKHSQEVNSKPLAKQAF